MKPIQLAQREYKDINVVVLGSNKNLLQEFEAQSEVDPDLQRVNVFSTTSISQAVRIVKEKNIQLSIVENAVEGKDFIFIQLELQQVNKQNFILPLIKTPSLTNIRQSQRLGGLFDIGDPDDLSHYDRFKTLILNYCRWYAAQPLTFSEIRPIQRLQKALLIGHSEWEQTKNTSSEIVKHLLPLYDFSHQECKNIHLAEKLYFPWIQKKDYETFLTEELVSFQPILNETSSWMIESQAPQSSAGFMITFSNFAADQIAQNLQNEEIVKTFLARPNFLKHTSMRAMGKESLLELLENITNRTEKYKIG